MTPSRLPDNAGHIRLHNSLDGHMTVAKSQNPQDPFRFYLCGPTVYDRLHIGNLRSAVVFDVLVRALRARLPQGVVFVRNFTDVDDKITARAAHLWPDEAPNRRIRRLTEMTTQMALDDLDRLGVQRPDEMPKASGWIDPMIALITTLITRGHAYVVQGHVFYKVSTNPHPHVFGRRQHEAEHARVQEQALKHDAEDFVLWKPSDSTQPGWDSPWGVGRPGWHIECSAMARGLLGETFDLHGGGQDLMFPHHANEIAQSSGACSDPHHHHNPARIWWHNGMVTVEGRKMSKSLGNVLTWSDFEGRMSPAAVRLGLLTSHPRSELPWTRDLERQSAQTWERWSALAEGQDLGAPVAEEVWTSLTQDLNTPGAIAALHTLAQNRDSRLAASMNLLGLLDAQGRVHTDEAARQTIDRLLAERHDAKAQKDWRRADALRDRLHQAGVQTQDAQGQTTWHVTPDFDPAMLSRVV